MVSTYCESVPDRLQSVETKSVRDRYRPEIDGLRALAVMAVIVNHFNTHWLPSGFLGVDIFFVISGFVVTSSLTGKPDQSWSQYLLTFYARRVKRLAPALVVCVVLTGLMGCLFIDGDLTQASLRTGISSLFGTSNFYILRQRTDYFGQSAELNLFTHTWSLGVEEQFYLLFPILLGLCGYSKTRRFNGHKNLLWAVLGLSTLSTAFYLYLSAVRPAAAFFLMPARFWELGAGCLVFLSRDRVSVFLSRPEAIRNGTSSPPACVAPLCTILLIGVLCLSKDFQTIATFSISILTCLLLWSFNRKSLIVKLLSSKWLVQIGLLSYSLYLWHWSVLSLSRWTIGISKWTIPFQLLLMVGLALASNRWIEKPLRYASWSPEKGRTLAYGFMAIIFSAFCLVTLNSPLKGVLYTGKAYPQAYESSFQIADQYKPCQNAATASPNLAECFYPQRTSSVTIPTRSKADKTLYFVGDSHAGSLQALASSLVQNEDVPRIFMLEREGCLFSSSLRRVDTDGEGCLNSNRAFISEIVTSSNPGDVVLVTNRHSLYFLKPNARDDILKLEKGMFSYSFEGTILSQRQALNKYAQNLVSIARLFAKKGVFLVVQAPLPDWKYPSSQCQPQWFRLASNLPTDCKLDFTTEVSLRSPLLKIFRQMEAEVPNLYVYDPFPAFCDAKKCDPFASDGTPFFKDTNHLNNYGAEHLYANFRQYLMLNSLIDPKDSALRSAL